MKGLYLYGICPFLAKKKALKIKGIDDAREIKFLHYKDIEAVVSRVELKKFNSEEIKRKAIEDLDWIKSKALAHEKVVELVMRKFDITLIPMKFGTIFKTEKSLLTSLKDNYVEFKKLLEKLKEKEEWSLKVYSDNAVLASAIKSNSSIFQEKLKEASTLPAGKDYFLEKEVEETAAAEVQKTLDGYRPLFLKAFQQIAEEAKENKILDRALTQKSKPMIFNGAFLIKKDQNNDFLKQVQRLEVQFKDKGIVFESSGPWPPYSFV